MSRQRRVQWIAVAVIGLMLAVLACGPEEDGGGIPSITITIPSDGVTVPIGEEVQIISTAIADAGVERVELSVNGEVLRRDQPPSGNPTAFSIAQPWTPTTEGDAVISVVVYDVNGTSSPAATISLRVQAGAVGDVTPTPVSATPTPVPDVESEEGCTLNASYVADVTIPDDTELVPGTSFVKTWRIRNSGTCDWGDGFSLVFSSGDQMGAPGLVAVPATAAGSTADVSVNLTAPNSYGTYRGNWRMQSDEGVLFGSTVYVRIVVPSPATDTPEPLAAPTDLAKSTTTSGFTNLVWVDNSDGEDGFHILADGAIYHTVGANEQGWGFVYADHFCDQTVDLTVVAYRSGETSDPSNAVSHTGPPCAGSLPDLQVHSMTVNPPSPMAGTNFDVEIVVDNDGDAAVSGFNVRLLLLNSGQTCPGGAGTVLFDRSLSVGAQAQATLNETTDIDTAGSHNLCVILDHMDNVEESEEANNHMQLNITVAAFEPLAVETAFASVDIPAGDVGWGTANCPAGTVVVGGGYASSTDMFVYNRSKHENGWRVYAQSNAGTDKPLFVYAVCLSGSGGSTEQVYSQVTAAAGGIGHAVAACPAGSIVTGGGWAASHNGNVIVYNSTRSGNGWQVYGSNVSGSDELLNAYAICLSGAGGATTTQQGASGSIPAGNKDNVVATCGAGSLATGGGFAGNDEFIFYNTSPNPGTDNQWLTWVENNAGSSMTLHSYVTCISR
jgi:hypothetical protein